MALTAGATVALPTHKNSGKTLLRMITAHRNEKRVCS